ncbi:hypothetical protein FPV67DRAFT_1475759 [Lyophyllum atratum]|nr:hypothetical protein FPV67DRAFT_1475759 [Lyophyllum atratum]
MVLQTPSTPQTCRFFQRGACTFGDACLNLHQPASRSKCIFFTMGRCAKGDDCSFAHPPADGQKSTEQADADESNQASRKQLVCRYWSNGNCAKGDDCQFAHDDPNENDGHITPSSSSSSNTHLTTDMQSDTPATSDPDEPTSTASVEDLEGAAVSSECGQHVDDAETFFSDEEHIPSHTEDVMFNAYDTELATIDVSYIHSGVHDTPEGESLPETYVEHGLADPDDFEEPEEITIAESLNHSTPTFDDEYATTLGDVACGQEPEGMAEPGNGDECSGHPEIPVTYEDSAYARAGSSSSQNFMDTYPETSDAVNNNDSNFDQHHSDAGVAFAEGYSYSPPPNDNQELPTSDDPALPAGGLAAPHWSEYADPLADLMVPFCKFLAQARCTQGDACRFRHSLTINEYAILFRDPQPPLWSSNAQVRLVEPQQRATTSSFNVCKFYPLGKCRNGTDCPYLHMPATDLLPVATEPPLELETEGYAYAYPSSPHDDNRIRPCKYFLESGNCRRGDQCYYGHDRTLFMQPYNNTIAEGDIHNRQQWKENQDDGAMHPQRHPCRRFQAGYCQWGDRCKYLHDTQSMEENGPVENNDSTEEVVPQPDGNGWGVDAEGWGSYIDEWAPKRQEANNNSNNRPANEKQPANGTSKDHNGESANEEQAASSSWPPEDKDDPWTGAPKDHNGQSPGEEQAASSNWPPEDKDDPWAEASKDHNGQLAVEEQAASSNWPPEDEDDPWAPKQLSCPYYAKGRCRKDPCNYSYDAPKSSPKGGGTPRSAASQEPFLPEFVDEDRGTGSWGAPKVTVAQSTLTADGWADDRGEKAEEEGEHFMEEGEPVAEERTAVDEERLSNEEEDTAIKNEEPYYAVEGASAAHTQLTADEDQITFPRTPNEDEETWAVEWSHEIPEPSIPPKLQAPCKAFGQGHCAYGDSCLYMHIVEKDAIVEDRRRSPTPVESHDGIDETETSDVGGLSIDQTSTINVEPELVVERDLFNCTIRFGLDNGCLPLDITTASESCRVVAVQLAEVIDDVEHEPDDLTLDNTGLGASIFLKFATPRDAVKAIIKLDKQTYDSRPLMARLVTERTTSPLECKTVKITWPSPSRTGWAYYPTITTAKTHEKRLNGMIFQKRKIIAAFSRPRPNDTTFAVKLSGFSVDADTAAIEQLAQASLVHMNVPAYVDCPLDSIRDTLAARGSLERFYRLPLDPTRVKHMAFASFDSGMSRVMGAYGVPQPFLGDLSLSLQKVHYANYKISARRYHAIRGVLEQLPLTCQEDCTLRVCDEAEPIDIHIYADAEKRAPFAATNRKLQAALLGEVLVIDGATVWDEYFDISSSERAIEKINGDTSFFVKVDHRMRRIRVIGDDDSRVRARGLMVRMQRHVLPLDLPTLRMLLDGAYTTLQNELGANKLTLDVALCRRPCRNPRKLSCRHVYCETCLQYVLQASAGLQYVLPRAGGGGGRCGEYIPYVIVRDVLRTVDEAALLRNAFLAYVRAQPEVFFFCPTPHCETVYRPVAEGRAGVYVYTCPTCFTEVCSACRSEYHEGLDCMAHDNVVVTG